MTGLVVITLALILMPLPAAAEPVSAAIGLTALIQAAGVGAAAAGALGGGIVGLGVSVALSAASAALQQSSRQGSVVGGVGVSRTPTLDPSVRQPQISPLPDYRLALGTVTSSGSVLLRRSKAPYLWRLFELASHECGAMEALIINGQDVVLNDNGEAIYTPFFDGTTIYIKVSYRNGSGDQVIDPIIAADFPTMPATFRQRGHTTLVIKAHYGTSEAAHKAVYGTNNVFNPLVRFQGARVIDPRLGSCRISDPSTWVPSRNAALNIMRYLYHPWPSSERIEPGQINWDLVAEAADICDRRQSLAAGGTEARYTCDGVIFSANDAVGTLKTLLTAFDGLLILDHAGIYPMPGAVREPVMTFHQDMLVGGFSAHAETPDADLINIVKTEFIAPDRDYKPVVGPTISHADFVRADGTEHTATLTLPFTEGHERAQRLAKRKMLETRGRPGKAGRRALSATFTLEAATRKAGDIVRIDFRDAPHVAGTYQITRIKREAGTGGVEMQLVEYDTSTFRFHAPTDIKPFVIDQTVLDAVAA